jgi:hypothetical protein
MAKPPMIRAIMLNWNIFSFMDEAAITLPPCSLTISKESIRGGEHFGATL